MGEGETRGRVLVLIKCDLDLYVRTLSRSSPTESRVRFPGTQNSTDKVEEKEFTELCLSVHFSVTVRVVMSRQRLEMFRYDKYQVHIL